MPPKGSKKSPKEGVRYDATPDWFNEYTVQLFIMLSGNARRKHRIFRSLTDKDVFADLATASSHWARVMEIIRDPKLFGTENFAILSPNIVLALTVNRWITGFAPENPGIFVHWWGSYDTGSRYANPGGSELPVFFMMRVWSPKEAAAYKRRLPQNQVRIVNASLTFALETPEMLAAGVVLMMPIVTDVPSSSDAGLCFEYHDLGFGVQVFGLFYIDGQIHFVAMEEASRLAKPPKSNMAEVEAGGPFYQRRKETTKRGATIHKWWFPTHTAECKEWMKDHVLEDGRPWEESIVKRLHKEFWSEKAEYQIWPNIVDKIVASTR